MTGPLDGHCQCPLMLCAVPCDAAGKNLASLGNVSLQLVGILVVNHIVLAAEYADLSLPADAALLPYRGIGFLTLIKSHFTASYPILTYTQT